MQDLRYKLTDEQRIEIRRLWRKGVDNYTQLALMFGVCPKTIRKVIDDDYRLACNEQNRENWRRYKPSKAHHAKLIREYRWRKKKNGKEV